MIVQALLAEHLSYPATMAITTGVVFAGASVVAALGQEKRARTFGVH